MNANATMIDPKDAVWDEELKCHVHPVAAMFPKLDQDSQSFKELEGSILSLHQQEPIVYDGEVLLDGRNRLAVCRKFGRKPLCRQWSELNVVPNDEMDPVSVMAGWIYAKNIARRHLTEDQRAAITVSAEEWEATAIDARKASLFKPGDPRQNPGGKVKAVANPKSGSPQTKPKRDIAKMHAASTAGKVADKAGVSRYKAEQALKIKKCAKPEVVDAVKAGRKSLREAAKELPLTPTQPSKSEKPTLEVRVNKWAQKFVTEFASEKEEAVRLLIGELS